MVLLGLPAAIKSVMLFDVVGPVRLAEKKEVAFDRISKIFVN